MSIVKKTEYMAAVQTAQESAELLTEYDRTKAPSLLPKIRSIKSDCQQAVDTLLKMLYSTDHDDPIRPAHLILLSWLYRMLGGVHMYLLKYSDAKNCYDSALELGEELGDASKAVEPLNNLGLIALQQNNPVEAVRLFRLAIERLDDDTEREFGATIRKNLKVAESALTGH